MSVIAPVNPSEAREIKVRTAKEGDHPSILTEIYQEDTNISIWQRQLSDEILSAVDSLLNNQAFLKASLTVSPKSALQGLEDVLQSSCAQALCEDIAELVDMFCFLFDLKHAGLRLTALQHAMCPRFHVDKVPCRLVTTYQGIATEWLPHDRVDRSKLGAGNKGKRDEESGLFMSSADICRLSHGDVALVKGELWIGNENAGLVHRSPIVPNNQQRLLLTLDFVSD